MSGPYRRNKAFSADGRRPPRDGRTIRGDLSLSMPDNLVHGSDSPESAEREIAQ